MQEDIEGENIAATLAKVLPKAELVHTQHGPTGSEADSVLQFAVPKAFDLKEIDTERLLPAPRRTVATATLFDGASFIAYVKRHALIGTVIWCNFDPQKFSLTFTAVIDEHALGAPGWRGHKAVLSPAMSAEWLTWKGNNLQPKEQLAFAEFLEKNQEDIVGGENLPNSLDMLKMATEFEHRAEQRLKSHMRLQDGGVRLEFIADTEAGTVEQMKLFERFAIGLPVFWNGTGFRIQARLKYRAREGKVTFSYDLMRPDLIYQAAALKLIEDIKTGTEGVPLLMGACA